MNSKEFFGEPIHIYTRAQAIEDGVLIDVSTMAREAGIVWPVALTSAAWADCVAWTDDDDKRKRDSTGQSEAGRSWDVVWMASRALVAAARSGDGVGDTLQFRLYRVPRAGRGVRPRFVMLKFVVGPGDAGEPVVTVMEVGED